MALGRFLVALGLNAAALLGTQLVTLQTGQVLRVDRADRDGDTIFLTVGQDVTLLGAGDVLKIEEEPDPRKPKPIKTTVAEANDPKALIRKAAQAHGLPVHIVESVAAAESAFRTDAVSHKGAIGVMQLMPGTARQLGVDPHDVEQNIEGGTRYLRQLLLKYQGDPDQVVKALAAYNAGPGAVARYGGVPPYRETRGYVRKIVKKVLEAEDREKTQVAPR
jgi:soluble lytic murein transglycosylase-like protein